MPRNPRCAAALLCATLAVASRGVAAPAELPGVGQSIVDHDIKVTLLAASRLSVDECLDAMGAELMLWSGGGFRLAFLVENRPGAPVPPIFGDVRVLVGSQPYNDVTDAVSHKPFAPIAMVRSIDEFVATNYGRELKARIPAPRPTSSAVVLELFVRGGPIPQTGDAVVELEQGETHRASAEGALQALSARESESARVWFRFKLPHFEDTTR